MDACGKDYSGTISTTINDSDDSILEDIETIMESNAL